KLSGQGHDELHHFQGHDRSNNRLACDTHRASRTLRWLLEAQKHRWERTGSHLQRTRSRRKMHATCTFSKEKLQIGAYIWYKVSRFERV
ncbi:hypothetical protein ACW9H6_29015, partial [Pseudomonas sp. SDO528_S397]